MRSLGTPVQTRPSDGRPSAWEETLAEAIAAPKSQMDVRSSMLISIERSIERAVRTIASILLVFEVVLLFAGVVSRYLLNRPLVWSDELASILFLWLAMLGASLAFQRGQHMRMTSITDAIGDRAQRLLECLAIVAPLLFLGLIIRHAYLFAEDESYITTPALRLSNSWRAAALPIGFALMFVFGVFRVLRLPDWRIALACVFLIAGATAALLACTPIFAIAGKWNLLIFFVAIVGVAVFSGIPVAFSFGLATFGYLALTTKTPVVVLVSRIDEGMSHLILLAIPLFVFLGFLMEATGLARVMLTFLSALIGHVRGGLSYVLVGAMYLVSGISGSKTADMAAVAPGLVPEMRARGEKPGELTALLAATGAQTETIPPSLALIAISSAAGVSTSALFTGGFVPGLVMGLILCALVWWRSGARATEMPERARTKLILSSFLAALPAILLPRRSPKVRRQRPRSPPSASATRWS